MALLRFLPLAYLSWFLGKLANLPLPQPLARWSILIFSRIYGIDVEVAAKPLGAYRSIGDFFTRDVRPEARPIADGIVSPVDGTLRSVEDIVSKESVTQVKGQTYSLGRLLAEDERADIFSKGQLWNFYLSPRDAHHIHSPVDGTIVRTVHIPGKLWPVNDWALHSIDGLFAVNERIVTYIQTERGLVAVVMVGATNVGRISLAYMALETNVAPWGKKTIRAFDHALGVPVARGQKIGTFNMGSSVLVVAQDKLRGLPLPATPVTVRYGQSCSVI